MPSDLSLAVVALVLSHGLALATLARRVVRGGLLSPVHFATLSVVLFYDVGLLAELLGISGKGAFPPLLRRESEVVIDTLMLVAATPWFFLGGALLLGPKGPEPKPDRPVLLRSSLFHTGAAALCGAIALLGMSFAWSAPHLWDAKESLAAGLGPYIIILYVPVGLLCFYTTVASSTSKLIRLAFVLYLLATAIAATLGTGERMYLLLPFLLLAVTVFRERPLRLLGIGVCLFLVAASVLPLFKPKAVFRRASILELVLWTVYIDLSRAPGLGAAVSDSCDIGTRVLPYPMVGYVHSALLFIPRSLAPFKGYPTATYYTGRVMGRALLTSGWDVGQGMLEEAVLNAGLLAAPFVLMLYGGFLAWLDWLGRRIPSAGAVACVGALWSCMYNLPVLMQYYGVVIAVCCVTHWLFATSEGPEAGEC